MRRLLAAFLSVLLVMACSTSDETAADAGADARDCFCPAENPCGSDPPVPASGDCPPGTCTDPHDYDGACSDCPYPIVFCCVPVWRGGGEDCKFQMLDASIDASIDPDASTDATPDAVFADAADADAD
jgi:hypothetical protein